jgi:hypothetical protein
MPRARVPNRTRILNEAKNVACNRRKIASPASIMMNDFEASSIIECTGCGINPNATVSEPIGELSYSLGYADAVAFHRAFRCWTELKMDAMARAGLATSS